MGRKLEGFRNPTIDPIRQFDHRPVERSWAFHGANCNRAFFKENRGKGDFHGDRADAKLMKARRIMVIAGETSGDILAAELVTELRAMMAKPSTYSGDLQPLRADLASQFFGPVTSHGRGRS